MGTLPYKTLKLSKLKTTTPQSLIHACLRQATLVTVYLFIYLLACLPHSNACTAEILLWRTYASLIVLHVTSLHSSRQMMIQVIANNVSIAGTHSQWLQIRVRLSCALTWEQTMQCMSASILPCPKCHGTQGYSQEIEHCLHFFCPQCLFSCFMKHYRSCFTEAPK